MIGGNNYLLASPLLLLRSPQLDSHVDTAAAAAAVFADSGIDASHPGLQGVKIMNGDPADFKLDTCGHGTHVAGTISARNT